LIRRHLRHGPGEIIYLNGNSYQGVWDRDKIRGKGKYTILTGDPNEEEPDTVILKVFGY
jgi:hypothetical protein